MPNTRRTERARRNYIEAELKHQEAYEALLEALEPMRQGVETPGLIAAATLTANHKDRCARRLKKARNRLKWLTK